MNIEILASGSRGNCYLLKTPDITLLIECGISYKEIQRKLNYKVSDIDACLISHSHKDHARSVKDLLKAGIDCYMSLGTAQELGVLKHHRTKIFNHNGNFIYVDEIIKNTHLKPILSIHDTKEPINFIITDSYGQRLLFMTDTAYSPYKVNDVTHLMIECNYIKSIIDKNVKDKILDMNLRNRIVNNHMSLETALGFLKANDLRKLKKIYVLHLSDSNCDEVVIKKEIAKATGESVVIC